MPGATLRATGEPYTEALNTRRYDFDGNVQWLIENRYVVTARFSATEQRHRHQFGEVIENDRHELLFGEVSFKVSEAAGEGTKMADHLSPIFRPAFPSSAIISERSSPSRVRYAAPNNGAPDRKSTRLNSSHANIS